MCGKIMVMENGSWEVIVCGGPWVSRSAGPDSNFSPNRWASFPFTRCPSSRWVVKQMVRKIQKLHRDRQLPLAFCWNSNFSNNVLIRQVSGQYRPTSVPRQLGRSEAASGVHRLTSVPKSGPLSYICSFASCTSVFPHVVSYVSVFFSLLCVADARRDGTQRC